MADPWDVFPDAPKAAPQGGDPWAAFPDAKPKAAPETRPAPRVIGAPMAADTPRPIAPPENQGPAGNVLWDAAKGVGNFYLDAYKNAPRSAWDLVKSTAHALNPANIPETAGTLFDLQKGAGMKLARFPAQAAISAYGVVDPEGAATARDKFTKFSAETQAPLDAFGEHFKQRYGGVSNILNTVRNDPIGAAADASMFFGGPTAGARAPSLLSRTAAAIDPLSGAGTAMKAAVTKVGEPIVSNALGATTGATARDIRAAGRAGLEGGEAANAFKGQFTGAADKSAPVEQARAALDQLGRERSAAYRSGMVDLSKDRTILDFGDINKGIGDATKVGSFKGANIAPAANDINAAMRSVVSDWETLNPKSPLFKDVPAAELTPQNFHTPEGIDALKRTIGNLRDSTVKGTPERVAADRVYNAIKGEIAKQAPAYDQIMADYAKASDELNEIAKTFSLGEKKSTDTALRKLQSTSRNNVQTNYGERGRLLDRLAEFEPSLPYSLAGQNLNALAPRGLVSKLGGMAAGGGVAAVNPYLLAAAPVFSPKVVGGVAYGAGVGARRVSDLSNALNINAPNVRLGGQFARQIGEQR